MSANIPITSQLTRQGSANFPVADSNDVVGSTHIYADAVLRDAAFTNAPALFRVGQLAYTQADGKTWRLESMVPTWVEVVFGGGGGAPASLIDSSVVAPPDTLTELWALTLPNPLGGGLVFSVEWRVAGFRPYNGEPQFAWRFVRGRSLWQYYYPTSFMSGVGEMIDETTGSGDGIGWLVSFTNDEINRRYVVSVQNNGSVTPVHWRVVGTASFVPPGA